MTNTSARLYTVRIDASDEHGEIWQAIHPAETVEADSADEAAQWVAQNENISAQGANRRILVWDGADADTGSTSVFVL